MITCSPCWQHRTGLLILHDAHFGSLVQRTTPPVLPPTPSWLAPALCFYGEVLARGSSVSAANTDTQNWGQIPAWRLSWQKVRKLRTARPLFLWWRCGELLPNIHVEGFFKNPTHFYFGIKKSASYKPKIRIHFCSDVICLPHWSPCRFQTPKSFIAGKQPQKNLKSPVQAELLLPFIEELQSEFSKEWIPP